MLYNGTFETIEFRKMGIEYLRGILHTFSSLNQPESNLIYDYDIVELKKGNGDLINLIQTNLQSFAKYPIMLQLIDSETFKKALTSWLFEKKLMSEHKINNYIDFFYNLLIDVTTCKSIYVINHSEFDIYDFGVFFEHFILESSDSLYLVAFSYTD